MTTKTTKESLMFQCKLCGQPCGIFAAIEWHPECYADYQEFIRNDYEPLIRRLGEERPLETLYALDPEFRADINAMTIAEVGL